MAIQKLWHSFRVPLGYPFTTVRWCRLGRKSPMEVLDWFPGQVPNDASAVKKAPTFYDVNNGNFPDEVGPETTEAMYAIRRENGTYTAN